MSTLLKWNAKHQLVEDVGPEVEALWWGIQAHPLDRPAIADPFSARLAREQRWSAEYTRRVIDEYKRFVLLAVTTPGGVTPSDAVDQAWHLHLGYTRDYWDRFCGSVLHRPLHHRPGGGNATEQQRYLHQYGRTLDAYRRVFGEDPPGDIWPSVARRFGPAAAFARVNTAEHLIVKRASIRRGVLGGAVGLTTLWTVTPVLAQASGPALVSLYLFGGAASLYVARAWRTRPPDARLVAGLALHGYEVAFLAGGARAVTDAVLAQLFASGSLAIREARATLSAPLAEDAHPLEQTIHQEVSRRREVPLTELQSFADSNMADLVARLRGLGLTETATVSRSLLVVLLVPSMLVAAAIVGGRDVLPACTGFALAYLVGLFYLSNRTGVTALGTLALAEFRRGHEYLREPRPREPVVRGGLLPAAIALDGLDALRRFELAEIADALTLARSTAAAEACTNSGGCGCG